MFCIILGGSEPALRPPLLLGARAGEDPCLSARDAFPASRPHPYSNMTINTGNVATWNVKGLNSDTKRQVVKSFTKSEKIKILCLQETHSSSTNSWHKSLGFKNAFWSHGNSNSRGVAVLWNMQDAQIIKSWKDDDGRIAIVTLQKDNNLITIGSVYAPNIDLSNNSQRIYNRFLQELEVYVLVFEKPQRCDYHCRRPKHH